MTRGTFVLGGVGMLALLATGFTVTLGGWWFPVGVGSWALLVWSLNDERKWRS
jgi:hypothetical protein